MLLEEDQVPGAEVGPRDIPTVIPLPDRVVGYRYTEPGKDQARETGAVLRSMCLAGARRRVYVGGAYVLSRQLDHVLASSPNTRARVVRFGRHHLGAPDDHHGVGDYPTLGLVSGDLHGVAVARLHL